jgi:GT2 family glycosyltransferase
LIHIAIATLGNQENIDKLLCWNFWHGVAHTVEIVYVLSQLTPVKLAPKKSLIVEYQAMAMGCGGARQHIVDYLFAHGLNKDDIIVFLDDDIEVIEMRWLERLIAPLAEGYSISGVEGRKLTKKMPKPEKQHFDYVSGGWMATKGEIFTYKCRFDERYFPNYWEDADLCFQAKQHGFKIACVGNVGLKHDETLKIGQLELLEINKKKFYEKWGIV